jgi:murein DD-endopeptidase MepM/ murein hydrolase activator NlpD
MRKAFLRTPVAFTRISSRFSTGRKHPILNRIRAHKGVDYAAPRGTPVKATGSGKIVLRGRKGGYGNTVVIQHGSRYSTLYAHLNGFARGLSIGERVKQGEIIGYVGSTGLATGPHLHYEFRVNGVHRNPLTVKLPDAAPLAKKYRADFKLQTENLIAQLELAKTRTVALQDN